jgi:restriction system protein
LRTTRSILAGAASGVKPPGVSAYARKAATVPRMPRRMARHGSGYDFGRFGEWAYRLFGRLPEWIGFAIPIALFVGLLEGGEALLLYWRESIAWLRPEANYRLAAFFLIPVLVFVIALLVFEMALITYVLRSGRWKLLHLQKSMQDIRSLPPREFERLVGAAYEQQGYRVDYAIEGKDGGIDLIMRRGAETVLVQCKNWYRGWTGVPEVRELYGVLTAEHASRGVFVTSGVFSDEAIAFARAKPLDLIDGEALLDMIETVQDSVRPFANGAQKAESPPTSGLNHEKLCPICGSPTIRKTARRGENAGTSFWSCGRFPDCYGIAPD